RRRLASAFLARSDAYGMGKSTQGDSASARSARRRREGPMTDSIGRFPVPDPAGLPDDLREMMEANARKAGFVPNVFRAYSHKPEHFRAFFHYYEVLMRGASGLSRAEREMIVVAVSAVNSCSY